MITTNNYPLNWATPKNLFIIFSALAVCYLSIYTPEAFANGLIKQLPKEVKNVQSEGLLQTIMNIFIAIVAIVAGVGLIGVPLMTLKIAVTTLSDIAEGKSSYAKLFGAVIAGVTVELILVAFIYFAWNYLTAAKDIIG